MFHEDVSSPEADLLLKRRELELERRLIAIRRENGILSYQPHRKQCAFHEAALFHYRYARTGNRFGKSEMGAAEDVSFALGYRPWYPVGNPLRTLGIPAHATKGLIVTTDWKKSREIFTENTEGAAGLGKLFKYIPKSSVGRITINHQGYINSIAVKHISGDWSVICFDTVQSYKQDPLRQESSFWDWAHIDEPIPERMFGAINRGLADRSGKVWFTCTPLSEPWIDQAFIPDISTMSSDSIAAEIFSKDRWMMMGSMDDNPYLSTEDIERVLSWYSDDEKECRRTGIPIAYAGIIYKEFRYETHVLKELPEGWTDWTTPPRDYTRRYSIDYHFRKNDAVLFICTAPTEHAYVYHELWKPSMLDETVRDIKTVHGNVVPQPGLIDPLASTPNKVTEYTALDEVIRLGLPVLPATKDPVNGIRSVKAWLKARDRYGIPMLRVAPTLRRFLFEISRGYVWKDDENKPLDRNNDMMENLYRLCLNGLQYIDPTDESDYRNIPMRSEFNVPGDASSFLSENRDRTERDRRYAERYPS